MEWMYFWSEFSVLNFTCSRGSGSYIKITLKGISSGNRCEKGGERSISREEGYGEFFQWKLWSSEICECVTVKGRYTRLFL